jgi:hypothetical protein
MVGNIIWCLAPLLVSTWASGTDPKVRNSGRIPLPGADFVTGIQKVMRFTDVNYMVSLQAFDKLVLLANESLYAYPFQSLVRVWRREADMAELGVSGERISRHRDSAVQFFRAGVCEGRMLGESDGDEYP